MVTAKGKIMLHRPTQHKPGILHSNILLDLILVLATQTNAVKSVVDRMFFICRRVSARFLHGFCTVSKRAEGAFRCKIRQRVRKIQSEKLRCFDWKLRQIETSRNWDESAACSLNQWAQGSSPWRCTTTTKSELFSDRRRVRIFCIFRKTESIPCFHRKTS